MPSLKLTKRSTEAAAAPATGQIIIRDSELTGFALRITSTGARSFVVECRVKGRNVRHTLGAFPRLQPDAARKMAMNWLSEVAQGRDPVAREKATKLAETTLREALEAYIGSRELREKTIRDYRSSTRTGFPDWLDRPIKKITREMVSERHREIGQTRGQATANLAMRVLRAILRFARDRYDLPDVATDRLSASRSWYRIERRTGHLKPHEMAPWIAAVQKLDPDHRDYLLVLLSTGLRRNEAAALRWEDVDLKGHTQIGTERLRQPMQAIEDRLFAGLEGRTAKVVPLRA